MGIGAFRYLGSAPGETQTLASGLATTSTYVCGTDVHRSTSTLLDISGADQATPGRQLWLHPCGAADDELTAGDYDPSNPGEADTNDPTNAFRYTGKRLDTGAGDSLDMGARRFVPGAAARFQQADYFNGALADLGPVLQSADRQPLCPGRRQLAVLHRVARAHGGWGPSAYGGSAMTTRRPSASERRRFDARSTPSGRRLTMRPCSPETRRWGQRARLIRLIEAIHAEHNGQASHSWSTAMAVLEDADRLPLLDDGMREVAAACIHAALAQQAPYAAYDAALALLSQDIVAERDFWTLYHPWVAGRRTSQPVAVEGEEAEEEILPAGL